MIPRHVVPGLDEELRTALDAARSALGLLPIGYAESITAGITVVKPAHLNELRAATQ